LFQPRDYPNAKVLPIFDQYFGPDRSPGSKLCAFGFEANPSHNTRLAMVEDVYQRAGQRVTIFRETAAGTLYTQANFFFTGDGWRDLAASYRAKTWLSNGGKKRPSTQRSRLSILLTG
jgi:hypothetical protein